MGYAPRGKGLESKEQYYNRMGGLLTLYAAVLQAALLLLWLTRGTRLCECASGECCGPRCCCAR